MHPSLETLRKRLSNRGSETKEMIERRLSKAQKEVETYKEFDSVILNDDFKSACKEAKQQIINFINTDQ